MSNIIERIRSQVSNLLTLLVKFFTFVVVYGSVILTTEVVIFASREDVSSMVLSGNRFDMIFKILESGVSDWEWLMGAIVSLLIVLGIWRLIEAYLRNLRAEWLHEYTQELDAYDELMSHTDEELNQLLVDPEVHSSDDEGEENISHLVPDAESSSSHEKPEDDKATKTKKRRNKRNKGQKQKADPYSAYAREDELSLKPPEPPEPPKTPKNSEESSMASEEEETKSKGVAKSDQEGSGFDEFLNLLKGSTSSDSSANVPEEGEPTQELGKVEDPSSGKKPYFD